MRAPYLTSVSLAPHWIRLLAVAALLGSLAGCKTDVDEDGFFLEEDDCDDNDPAINPDAPEICDGLDNDCDQFVDESLTVQTYLPDVDGDGFGAGIAIQVCDPTPPDDHVVAGGLIDCDDSRTDVFPNAPEVCDGIDNDCDGSADEGFDQDDDGVLVCGEDGTEGTADDDCDDDDENNFPGNVEICDGRDNDCDELVDAADVEDYVGEDADGDGDPSILCPSVAGTDCDDSDPLVDGLDRDLDGFTTCQTPGDCDDEDPFSYPGADESCDGDDNDCDGLGDDTDPDTVADFDGDGVDGIACGGTDCDDGNAHVFPAAAAYTSGLQFECEAAVYPGLLLEWHATRVEQPFVLEADGSCFLFFRGGGAAGAVAGIGVIEDPTCSGEWPHPRDNPNNPVLEQGEVGTGWASSALSNPAAYVFTGKSRPYGLLFHGRFDSGDRDIGLVTATDPLGPYLPLDHDGNAITEPVVKRSTTPEDLDSQQAHHPTAIFDGTTVHLWYTGRSTSTGDFYTLYASSPDGVDYEKWDDNQTIPRPDIVYGEVPGSWTDDRVVQPAVLENTDDPEGGYAIEHWAAGRASGVFSIGQYRGSETEVEECSANPILEAPPAPRLGHSLVGGLAPRLVEDGGTRTYQFLYGAVAELAPVTWPTDTPYTSSTGPGAFIGRAHNTVPEFTVTNLAAGGAMSASFTLQGQVTDNAPDTTVVEVEIVAQGGERGSGVATLGTVAAPPSPSDPGVQTAGFTVPLSGDAGTWDILVSVEDEGCASRTIRLAGVTIAPP